MKSVTTEQIIRDVNALPEEKKLQVAEFIRSLMNGAPQGVDQNMIASRLLVLEEMDRLAEEIGDHWQENVDAPDLVSSMRR